MAFPLSPGINVSEIDLSTVIPSTASSAGGFAGQFSWGPIEQIVTVTSENVLKDKFSTPNSSNYQYWYTAANFLAYSNNLKVVRAGSTGTKNATANGTNVVLIANSSDYETNHANNVVNRAANLGAFAAKYGGSMGNSLYVSVCPNANAFSQNLTSTHTFSTASSVTTSDDSVVIAGDASAYIMVGDLISLTKGSNTTNYVEVTAIEVQSDTTVTVASNFSANVLTGASVNRRWKYYNEFTAAPGTSDSAYQNAGNVNVYDEMHIVVVDAGKKFSGVVGNIIEKYAFVSKASDALNSDKTPNYYKTVVNEKSKYLWVLDHPEQANTTSWGTPASSTPYTEASLKTEQNYYKRLAGGTDGTVTDADLITAYNIFNNTTSTDIGLMMTGPASSTVVNHVINNIAEVRKDFVVFVSPRREDVVENSGSEVSDISTYRDSLASSSFAVMDSGWKYQFDKYNCTEFKNLWVPLNGDIAGLSARTDYERDPWYSPAGLNRGQIKNVIKLAWNPSLADRDDLYKKGINPVVSLPGEGTVLFGDKTMQSRPSAFDRINVRRLFIVLEKSIAKAARSTLFEFNDQFTRAQFRNLVEPFLRDVQGRRGITDFRVVCDETNNTPEVIDRNEFVGDIYIKPARSANFIQLNFVAVRSDVNFDEIVGTF